MSRKRNWLPHVTFSSEKPKPNKTRKIQISNQQKHWFPSGFEARGLSKSQQSDPGHVWPSWRPPLQMPHSRRPQPKHKEFQGTPRNSQSRRNRRNLCLLLPCTGVPPAQPSSPSRESLRPHPQWMSHLPKTAVRMGPIYFPFTYFPLGWLTFPNENTSIKADLIMLMASDSPSPQCGCTRINLSSPIP